MEFSQSVKEALQHYVYCLIDPRDKKIFYIGKGIGNRVFQHSNDALDERLEDIKSYKLETIREIHRLGYQVEYYIIRYGLTKDGALLVESVLIDTFTYQPINTEFVLTNIQAGHHSWDKGIKTIDEINIFYNCADLQPLNGDKLMCININKTYHSEERNNNIYEATRKYWKLNGKRAQEVSYVLATFRGIVRAVFKLDRWFPSKDFIGRWEFEGVEIPDSPYLNKSVKMYINKGAQNPISYI